MNFQNMDEYFKLVKTTKFKLIAGFSTVFIIGSIGTLSIMFPENGDGGEQGGSGELGGFDMEGAVIDVNAVILDSVIIITCSILLIVLLVLINNALTSKEDVHIKPIGGVNNEN